MSVIIIVGLKCTLAASHAAPGETDEQTEDARPLPYAFCHGRGQHNNDKTHENTRLHQSI